MVGAVLEANEGWDIGNEVISCISKDFRGVLPIRPKVRCILSSVDVSVPLEFSIVMVENNQHFWVTYPAISINLS